MYEEWWQETIPADDAMSFKIREMYYVDRMLGLCDNNEYHDIFRRTRAAYENSKLSIRRKLTDRGESLAAKYITLGDVKRDYLLFHVELELECQEASRC
jgi:hypothetical protein